AEIAVDIVLFTVAYYLAFALRFEGFAQNVWLYLFVQSVPLVVALQLAGLVVFGVYRTLWRFITLADVVNVVRALAVANLAGALALRLISRTRGAPLNAVGFLDDDPGKRYRRIAGVPVLGTIADLETVLERHRIEVVLYANDLPLREAGRLESLRASCARFGA